MEENQKGAFLSKVEDFAKEMSEMTSEREGVKRGLIVLAVEDVKDEDDMKSIISVFGNNDKLAELIALFATQDETKPLVSLGLKLCVLKAFIDNIEGGNLTINLFVNH